MTTTRRFQRSKWLESLRLDSSCHLSRLEWTVWYLRITTRSIIQGKSRMETKPFTQMLTPLMFPHKREDSTRVKFSIWEVLWLAKDFQRKVMHKFKKVELALPWLTWPTPALIRLVQMVERVTSTRITISWEHQVKGSTPRLTQATKSTPWLLKMNQES